MWYHYNGDSMNDSVIVTINNEKDIAKIDSNTKFINIGIDSISKSGIDYFLDNGKDYLYSDSINNINGFIYTEYDTFKHGEDVISKIIDKVPSNLNTNIEKVRYLYISLGRMVSAEINVMEKKNEIISFENTSIINNIWGALKNKKVNDISCSKIFMYLCLKLGIKSELVNSSIKEDIGNKIYLEDNNYIVVNLYKDLPNIQGRFMTKYFDKYNNDKEIDKKVCYIDKDYTNIYLDDELKKIDYLDSNVVEKILSVIEKYINIRRIGPLELSEICKNVFRDYLPNYNVKISNFYVNDDGIKKHFIVINYGDKYYSYNYNKNSFMSVSYKEIYNDIESNIIGLYDNEEFVLNNELLVGD